MSPFELLQELEQYLLIRRGRARLTATGYRRDARLVFEAIEEELGRPLELADLTRERLQAYLDELAATPATRQRRGAALRAFFRYASIERHLCEDVGKLLDLPKLRRKRLPWVLTADEADRLVEAPITLTSPRHRDVFSYRDAAFLEVLYGTGMRVSESLQLTAQGLRFERGAVVHRVIGKGDKERIVVVAAGRGTEAIRRYLQRRHEIPGARDNDALFLNWYGGALTRQGGAYIVRRWGKRLGLRAWPHLLRHTYATVMVGAAGEGLRGVQELLGHEDPAQTARYAQVSMERLLQTARLHPRAHLVPGRGDLVKRAHALARDALGRAQDEALRVLVPPADGEPQQASELAMRAKRLGSEALRLARDVVRLPFLGRQGYLGPAQ